jgi:hypothetical protein
MLRDWVIFIRAARALLAGVNPYTLGTGPQGFYNPIWTLIIFIPFTWLPDGEPQFWAFQSANIIMLILLVRRLHPRMMIPSALLILFSAGYFGIYTYGNIDNFVWLGLLFPAPIGLLFLLMKPQIGALAAGIILLRRFDRAGLLGVIGIAWPLALATGVWVAVYGLPGWGMSNNAVSNIAMWPYGLWVGVPLALAAVWKRSLKLAMFAAPFLTPFISLSSYICASHAMPFWGFWLGWVRLIFGWDLLG